ncbi:MAG TPA: alpha/beta fold hydrolase [Solirubrobacteraceae bacterium]
MRERAERVPIGDERLEADLTLPADATAVVVFAHGSGSGRRSPRNREVAADLVERGFATLLVDLLTSDEAQRDERTAELRFDVALLGERVAAVLAWLAGDAELARLHVGLFGASTGAAAALIAAAHAPDRVAAVVSRGGRPDLAGDALARVSAPTLLIVGGEDEQVLTLNRAAQGRLSARSHLEVVPGAGHLFEEPGKLAQVSRLAADWFAAELG